MNKNTKLLLKQDTAERVFFAKPQFWLVKSSGIYIQLMLIFI